MHSRWLIKHASITKRLLDYRYVAKFLKVRSNYKVNLRLGSVNRNNKLRKIRKEEDDDDNINLSSKDLQEIVDGLEE